VKWCDIFPCGRREGIPTGRTAVINLALTLRTLGDVDADDKAAMNRLLNSLPIQ